jgi:hypothetical protein
MLIALAALVALIVIEAATREGHRTDAATKGAGAVPAVSPVRPPVRPGAPDTPRAVLYRFASAYGELSRATVTERGKLLRSLAAPPLLSQLRPAGQQGELTASSSILRKASIDSLLVSLQLSAPSGRVVHGAVVIAQWPVGPGESGVAPLRTSYVADLIKADGAWRISEFKLVP